jgi:hypothetical protein
MNKFLKNGHPRGTELIAILSTFLGRGKFSVSLQEMCNSSEGRKEAVKAKGVQWSFIWLKSAVWPRVNLSIFLAVPLLLLHSFSPFFYTM